MNNSSVVSVEKVPPEIRRVPLTGDEVAEVEDTLVNSFLVNEPAIAALVTEAQAKAKENKDIKQRLLQRETTINDVILLIRKRWGGRGDKQNYSLAELCVGRFWNLTDPEQKAKKEMDTELAMMAKQVKKAS